MWRPWRRLAGEPDIGIDRRRNPRSPALKFVDVGLERLVVGSQGVHEGGIGSGLNDRQMARRVSYRRSPAVVAVACRANKFNGAARVASAI